MRRSRRRAGGLPARALRARRVLARRHPRATHTGLARYQQRARLHMPQDTAMPRVRLQRKLVGQRTPGTARREVPQRALHGRACSRRGTQVRIECRCPGASLQLRAAKQRFRGNQQRIGLVHGFGAEARPGCRLAETRHAIGITQLEQHALSFGEVTPGRPHRPRESQPHDLRLAGDQSHHASPIANSRPNTTSR